MKSGKGKYRRAKFCLFRRQTLVEFALNEHFRHLCFTTRDHHGMHVRRWEECEKFPLFVTYARYARIFSDIQDFANKLWKNARLSARRMKMMEWKRGKKSAIGVCEVCSGDKLVFQLRPWHGHLLHFRDGSLLDGYKTTTRRNSAVNLWIRTDRDRGRGKKVLINDINAGKKSRIERSSGKQTRVTFLERSKFLSVKKIIFLSTVLGKNKNWYFNLSKSILLW